MKVKFELLHNLCHLIQTLIFFHHIMVLLLEEPPIVETQYEHFQNIKTLSCCLKRVL